MEQSGTVITVEFEHDMTFRAADARGLNVTLDSSAAHGGNDNGLSPMQMLLVGLGGCTGMDVLSILRKKRLTVTGYRIEVSGLQAETYPRIYTDITVHHTVIGEGISEDAVRGAVELSEQKYCSVYAMLKEAATITSSFEVGTAPAGE